MSSIEQKRAKLLEEKLREMGNDGIRERAPENMPFFDQDSRTKEENPSLPSSVEKAPEEAPYAAPSKRKSSKGASKDDYGLYRERFLCAHHREGSKSGFTINARILQMLRDVLSDLQEGTTLTAYIENILFEHLKTHQDLLNTIAEERRRNKTLDL